MGVAANGPTARRPACCWTPQPWPRSALSELAVDLAQGQR
jgi:hypothetical protein